MNDVYNIEGRRLVEMARACPKCKHLLGTHTFLFAKTHKRNVVHQQHACVCGKSVLCIERDGKLVEVRLVRYGKE